MFTQDLHVCQIARLLPEISRKTIGLWFQKFRTVCCGAIQRTAIAMTGEVDNNIVEIDESLFGKKRKYNRGAPTRQCWVFGLVQRNSRKLVLEIVEDRRNSTLHPILQRYVEVGTTIYHDDWVGYRHLEEMGYKHGAVNHTETFVSPTGVCTNTIEGIWGDVKLRLRSMHGVSIENLLGHLNEYCYRFMHRDCNGSIYQRFLQDCKAPYEG